MINTPLTLNYCIYIIEKSNNNKHQSILSVLLHTLFMVEDVDL